MNSVLVDEKLIRNAIVRGDSIYIDWNSDFDVFQDVNKVRVREIRKKPEYTLCKTHKNTTKNKKTNPDRIELNKYCKFCKKHTAHKETK